MEAKVIINNVDFSPWIAEDGIEYSDISRQGREVTVLNGTLYKSEILKKGLDVSLVELRDSTLATLQNAITSPATVQFTTRDGQLVTRTCYVSDITATAKTVRGGNTYFSGVSFSVEER